MENKVIQDRLALLRKKMQEEGIDFYMMPTADFHNSEYVNDYFKVREYFSNFTGSNGTLLVWKDGAGLWTDGRYFIQAEAELEGTGVELFKKYIGPKVKIKAAGGVSSMEDLEMFLELGCDRIGTSRAVGLCKGELTEGY